MMIVFLFRMLKDGDYVRVVFLGLDGKEEWVWVLGMVRDRNGRLYGWL